MNEMIQEAVLESIQAIDDQQFYAEYDVLMSLCATYMKSAMIQEAATGLEFDGYDVIQEADDTQKTKTKREKGWLKKKFLSLKLVQWIIGLIDRIRAAIAKASKKDRLNKKEMKNLAGNVGSVEVKGSQYDAGDTTKWDASGTVGTDKVAADVKTGDFSATTIPITEITISGFSLCSDPDKLEAAVKAFADAVDEYVTFEINQRSFGSSKLPAINCAKIQKMINDANDTAASKQYTDCNYGWLSKKIIDLDKYLKKAKARLEEYKGKIGEYYDNDNNRSMTPSQYSATLTDDDRANLTDKQKATLELGMTREVILQDLTKVAARLGNNIAANYGILNNMWKQDKENYRRYVSEMKAQVKKQKEDKAAKMPSMDSI